MKTFTRLTRKTGLHRKKPMKRVSKKRAEEMGVYSERRKAFLKAYPVCQVWLKENGWAEIEGTSWAQYEKNGDVLWAGILLWLHRAPQATEVHHRERRGKKYLDQSTWMAVCRENHVRIHNNPSWARQNGFLK